MGDSRFQQLNGRAVDLLLYGDTHTIEREVHEVRSTPFRITVFPCRDFLHMSRQCNSFLRREQQDMALHSQAPTITTAWLISESAVLLDVPKSKSVLMNAPPFSYAR